MKGASIRVIRWLFHLLARTEVLWQRAEKA